MNSLASDLKYVSGLSTCRIISSRDINWTVDVPSVDFASVSKSVSSSCTISLRRVVVTTSSPEIDKWFDSLYSTRRLSFWNAFPFDVSFECNPGHSTVLKKEVESAVILVIKSHLFVQVSNGKQNFLNVSETIDRDRRIFQIGVGETKKTLSIDLKRVN